MNGTLDRLDVRLLGDFRLDRDKEPVTTLNSPRLQSLLTYLLLHRDAPQPRDHVAFTLWPDSTETRARGNLRRLIYRLRNALPDADCFLEVTDQTLQWRPDAPFTLDVADLEQAASRSTLSTLQEAVALYQGDLLPGCYDDWILPERERLRRILLDSLERLIALLEEQRDYRAAIRYARRLLRFDPLREASYRDLMRLHTLSGDRAGALNVYHTCATILREELAVEPSPPTRELYERLLRLDTASQAQPTADLTNHELYQALLPARHHNLPAQPTSLVGREIELGQIAELLDDPDCRLLTLAGLGGVGKTRLALQAAAEKIGQFGDGVYLIVLTALESTDLLVSAIADAVQFGFRTDRDRKAQLLDYLRRKEMLLVLDNFEQNPKAADLATEILSSAPQVKILSTSRERLNLRWEWLLEVAGLDVPESQSLPDLESYGATELFLQIAQQVRPGLSLTEQERHSVVRICRLVEGMPLAIELAAAWMRSHTAGKIAQEIERNLDFLVTSLRDVPERHRSLRAVFAHSWSLLPEKERRTLAKLSVFRGGFEGEAAEGVAGASPALLASLVDKFLLRRTSSGRFEIHELSRQYALERLEQRETRRAVEERHCEYYMGLLQQTGPLREQKREAFREIDREMENLQAGWRWAVAQDKIEAIDRSLEGLFLFYAGQSWFQEGAEAFKIAVERLEGRADEKLNALAEKLRARWGAFCVRLSLYDKARKGLERALSFFRDVDDRVQMAFSLKCLGEVLWKVGEYDPAGQLFQESLAIYRELGDKREIATALNNLGVIYHNLGEYQQAQTYHRQSLEMFQALNDLRGIATALHRLAHALYDMGQYEKAKAHNRESLALRKQIGDQWGVAASLNNLGIVLHDLGAYEEARHCYQESLTVRQEVGDRWGIAASLNNLGVLALDMKNYREARAHYRKTLAICREIGDRRGTAIALDNLGVVAFYLKAFAEAKEYHQQALGIFREIGNLRGMTFCLAYLGHTACALGAYQEAKAYFSESLQVAEETQATPRMADALLGFATLLKEQEKSERALELAALVRHHPASEQATKDKAQALLSDLASKLSASTATVAQDRGRSRELGTVVQELLDF